MRESATGLVANPQVPNPQVLLVRCALVLHVVSVLPSPRNDKEPPPSLLSSPCRRLWAARRAAAKGIGGIVIDPNLNRLFFMLTASFFAFAVVRTVVLWFS